MDFGPTYHFAPRGSAAGEDIPDLKFTYDAMGNRVTKLIKTRTGRELDREDNWSKTYYVRVAQGNVMATYNRVTEDNKSLDANHRDVLYLKEQHLYGSSRIGVHNADRVVASRKYNIDGVESGVITIRNYSPTVSTPAFGKWLSKYTLGMRQYELSNHTSASLSTGLGNVLSVITDHTWANTGSGDITSFSPHIIAANDYYPFGMQMPGRSYNAGEYRYGYNTQESVDEIKGMKSHYTAPFWEYDPRVVIRWNRDPVTYPWQSSYAINNNNPIVFTDPLGLYGTKRKAERQQKKDLKRYGEERVGDVYNRNEGTDKDADWGYQVFDEGKSKQTRARPGKSLSEGIFIIADRPDATVFDDNGGNTYKKGQGIGFFNDNAGWYNQPMARAFVPDVRTIGLSSNVSAILGMGATPINFSILARGQNPGIYFTPTINASVGTGAEANAGVAFSAGWYTGNVSDITQNMLIGSSYGASSSLGADPHGSLGASYAPTGRGEGFVSLGGQFGIGLEGSPATIVNAKGNYQWTPVVIPVFQIKR